MSKQSFINEIKEYKRSVGVMSFAYGDHRLPVVYQEDSDVIRVNMSQYDVFMPVDYRINSTCTGGYDRILSCKLNADSAIP